MYLERDIPLVRYVPTAREKQGFISYRIEHSEIYRICATKYIAQACLYIAKASFPSRYIRRF